MTQLISQTDHPSVSPSPQKTLQHITSAAFCNSSNDRLLKAAPSPCTEEGKAWLASFMGPQLVAYVKISHSPASPRLMDAMAADLQTYTTQNPPIKQSKKGILLLLP